MSSRVQNVQDLAVQLEVAEHEIKLMGLESIEYQSEINLLKQQNEGLLEQNSLYCDSVQREQQQIMFLRTVSMDLVAASSHNDDLKFQISEYQTTIKDLETQNNHLQQKNTKYQLTLEKVFEERQTRTQLHKDHVTSLENKIQKLQKDCDELRQEVLTLNALPTHCDWCAFNTKQSPLALQSPSEKSVFRLNINKRYSLQQNRCAEHIESEIKDAIAPEDDITAQLLQFGYVEDEILVAINAVNNKYDINEIVEHIEHRNYGEYEMKIAAKAEEIDKLKALNNRHEAKIHKLQQRIKRLTVEQVPKNENCFGGWSMNWFQ